MSVWYRKNLGDAMLAGEQLDLVKEVFLTAFEQADRPQEMAIFFRHESEGRLHCEVHAYFSPAAVAVATAVDAIPCPKPSPVSLDLLAGSDHAWKFLFPERTC